MSETVLSMSVSLIHPVYLVLHTGCRKRKRDIERERTGLSQSFLKTLKAGLTKLSQVLLVP